MRIISRKLCLLILTLTLVSCGAKNGGESSSAPTIGQKSGSNGKSVSVSDTGSKIEVSSPAATEESGNATVVLPDVQGPVLVVVISPDEVTETVVNVDPSEPNAEPEAVVEVIVDVQKPVVYENVVQVEEAGPETVTEVTVPAEETTVSDEVVTEAPVTQEDLSGEVLPEVITAPSLATEIVVVDTTVIEVIKNPTIELTAEEKKQLLKRISVLEHRINVLNRNKPENNQKMILEWTSELQKLKSTLEAAERL